MANSASRTSVDVGAVIGGTYTIEALLGRGGMGAVFIASHARLPGKRVAIKVLHAELADAELLARFRREAEIASRLGHPNIVGVTDFNVTDDGVPYLVLELLEGQTLAERIAAGPMPLPEVTRIVRQVASALAAAHREGIVHRDLKPQNVFLVPTEVGGTIIEQVKVLDFGISKIQGSQTIQTLDNALLGTPQYMAPEQAKGEHSSVDERTDLFALGAIVYEMITGRAAFAGANVPEVVFKVVFQEPPPVGELAPATPPTVIAALEQALLKGSAERAPPTVAEFVEALTGEPLVTRARDFVPRRPRRWRRHPRAAARASRPGRRAHHRLRPRRAGDVGLAETVGSSPGQVPSPAARTQATPATTPTIRPDAAVRRRRAEAMAARRRRAARRGRRRGRGRDARCDRRRPRRPRWCIAGLTRWRSPPSSATPRPRGRGPTDTGSPPAPDAPPPAIDARPRHRRHRAADAAGRCACRRAARRRRSPGRRRARAGARRLAPPRRARQAPRRHRPRRGAPVRRPGRVCSAPPDRGVERLRGAAQPQAAPAPGQGLRDRRAVPRVASRASRRLSRGAAGRGSSARRPGASPRAGSRASRRAPPRSRGCA
ncbi:MAG: serine/threonine-protein kinase [Kofleriaceae bacterium]